MPAATSSLIETIGASLVWGWAARTQSAAPRSLVANSNRDHGLIELVILVRVVGRGQRSGAQFCGGLLLPVSCVALAIGTLSVPMRPVAISTACVPLVPGRVFHLGVTRRVDLSLVVAAVLPALVVSAFVICGREEGASAFV
eukprot:5023128-Pleurochrysis_carterae.AAC.2